MLPICRKLLLRFLQSRVPDFLITSASFDVHGNCNLVHSSWQDYSNIIRCAVESFDGVRGTCFVRHGSIGRKRPLRLLPVVVASMTSNR